MLGMPYVGARYELVFTTGIRHCPIPQWRCESMHGNNNRKSRRGAKFNRRPPAAPARNGGQA
jgi:hypothetical protein